MAVATTAPATRHPAAAEAVVHGSRSATRGFVWLTLVAAAAAGLVVVGQSTVRLLLPVGAAEGVALGLWLGGGALALAVAIAGWLVRRDAPGLLIAASLAPVLVAVQLVSSALLVDLHMPTLARVAEAGLGLAVLGLLVGSATLVRPAHQARATGAAVSDEFFRRVAEVTTFAIFATGLSGVVVRAVGASWACRGFPDCSGLGLLPFGRDDALTDIHVYHRLLAYMATALVLWLAVEARRTQSHVPAVQRAALLLAVLTLTQGAVGALAVLVGVPVASQALHAAVGVATWTMAVVLVVLAHRRPVLLPVSGGVGVVRVSTLGAYVQLTKPRVMSLLLATTVAAMVIAARGMPPLDVFLLTLVGGALMSGGAGAINHYVDRDIDPLMGRTAWRPIPSGVIAPAHALWFGIALAALAMLLLGVFVNPLAAGLAILGLLGYVFMYSLWLKRSTPSNIVIGGAAGAIPPMVGWAAVTNDLSGLTPWYLFAIIFFWTPPHFWALSLLIRRHYERAGVPMLPVVRGDAETRRQILLYSLLLVALTLVLSPVGLMGLFYFGAATVLGAAFIVGAVVLIRAASATAARRLYLYSIAYLFALFTAMAVDRVLA